VPAGSEITVGSTIDGTLQTGQPTATYTFAGEVGQTITIALRSSDFDSYLRLQDSTGHDLITDDDSGGGLDARIAVYTLPANDTYTVAVESYDSRYGAYTLTLTEAKVESIEYGQTISGSIETEGDSAIYRFHGSADDFITISLKSPDFDTYLNLADSTSTSLITNDDGGGSGTDSFIGPYRLPADGDYSITVSSYDSTAKGSYTLTLNHATLTPIAYGDTANATFGNGVSAVYYSFEGKNGDLVTVAVDSGESIDTSLLLNGPDGYQVAFDEDGGPGFDPEIYHQLLTQDGTYTLVLQAAVPGDSGSVSLSLKQSPAPSLDEGAQQVRLSSTVAADVVTFTGHAGETVRLTATTTSASSPSLTVTQAGTEIASGSGSIVSALTLEFKVPADGIVTVQLSDYSYTNIVYQVSVERVNR
jgi:hypothetical protein